LVLVSVSVSVNPKRVESFVSGRNHVSSTWGCYISNLLLVSYNLIPYNKKMNNCEKLANAKNKRKKFKKRKMTRRMDYATVHITRKDFKQIL